MKGKFDHIALILQSSDLKLWASLAPTLIALFIVMALFMPYPWSFVGFTLLILLGIIITWSVYRVTQVGLTTQIERNELRSIVVSLPDALLAYDQDFHVLYFNPAAESLFNIPAKNILNQKIEPHQANHPEEQLLVQVVFPSLAPAMVSRSHPGEYPQVVDLSFSEPELELRVITSPITDNAGRILGFLKMIRNRTREVSLLRSKTEFIAVASHQLRTPITEVNWAIEALLGGAGLEGANKEIAERANQSAKHLMSTVEDLLNVAQIEQGKFGYNFAPGDLVDFIGQILKNALPQVERAGIKLYFDRPQEALPPAFFDPSKLSMVLVNLVDNAVRYNVQNGQIIVGVSKSAENPFLEVRVSDTGIGVSPEAANKIFTKFYRAENALKAETEGSGLGLYIAKNIVEAHGGQIWMRSEVSRGSTFTFTVPISADLLPRGESPVE